MATGDGIGLQTISVREDSSHSIIEITKRQIYWARYIDVSPDWSRALWNGLFVDILWFSGL